MLVEQGEWEERDRKILAESERILGDDEKPQFLVTFLMSTHYNYRYPKEYERYTPVLDPTKIDWNLPFSHREELFNRYRNATAFLDAEVFELISRLDPSRNIIVVTGDHGESIFDDSTLSHSSRASEIQTRVPMVMVGPGVPVGTIEGATCHADLFPTLLHVLSGRPVPIAHCHGRDLLTHRPREHEIVIFPHRRKEPQHLVLIRSEQRLRLKLWSYFPRLEVVGFFDQLDDADPYHVSTADELLQWKRMLRKELERLSL